MKKLFAIMALLLLLGGAITSVNNNGMQVSEEEYPRPFSPPALTS